MPRFLLSRLLLSLLLCAGEAVRAETRAERIADLHRRYADCLALVKYPDGGASAFIVQIGKGQYLVTNTHVMAGLATPTFLQAGGRVLQVGDAAAAVDHDLMAFGVNHSGPALEMMPEVDKGARVGDEVVVLGNPAAAGVIRPVEGRIVALGPNLIEVSAAFIPGNSGSPIIHLKTGQVVGVVSFLTRTAAARESGNDDLTVRHFGYRLDSVKQWSPVRWDHFLDDYQTVAKVEARTFELDALLESVIKHRPIRPETYKDTAILASLRQYGAATTGAAASPSAFARQNRVLFESLQTSTREDIAQARRRVVYDFFQKDLDRKERQREPIARRLELLLSAKP